MEILRPFVSDDESETDEDKEKRLYKHGYDFSGDTLKITKKYMNLHNKKKLFATFFKWIVDKVDIVVLEEMVD